MKTQVLCMIVILSFSIPSFSQTVAIAGKYEYQKGDKPAAVIEFPFSVDVVEGALSKKIAKGQVKEERLKGMQVFKGTRLTPTDGEVVDMYFKVERQGKKDDNKSLVYLILGRPNENVALRMPDDDYRLQEARVFLNRLSPDIEAYKLELDISAQEEGIKKGERNLKNLTEEQRSLESRIHDLQDKLQQNKMDQQTTNADIAKQKTVRDSLVAKRTTSR
jgi:hypothetical protein